MLETNASDGVIAGILLQLHLNSEWHPIAVFFIKIIALIKCNYKVHNKELLAII